MHEVSIAQNILKIALDEAGKNGFSKINRICIKVGKLTALVPECLHFAFENISRETAAEKAILEIDEIEATGHCRSCEADFNVEDFFCICEKCGSQDVVITGGEDLAVADMDVE